MSSNPGENIFFVENSPWFVGKICWNQNAAGKYPQIHWKIPADTPEKNTRIFTSICRGTASHNVYLTGNTWKLKTVYKENLSGMTIRQPPDDRPHMDHPSW